MRARWRFGNSARRAAIVLALAAVGLIGSAARTEAVIAIIRSTGIFSLAPGQATIAHVVNTGNAGGIVIDWRVLDETGAVLEQSDRRVVAAGASDSFEFRPTATGRLPIRVVLAGVARSGPGKHSLIATQEIFNTSDGSTTVVLPYIEQ